MALGFTSSIMEIATLASGSVVRVMGSECRLALMGAAMLGSSREGSSMALDATILGTNFTTFVFL